MVAAHTFARDMSIPEAMDGFTADNQEQARQDSGRLRTI